MKLFLFYTIATLDVQAGEQPGSVQVVTEVVSNVLFAPSQQLVQERAAVDAQRRWPDAHNVYTTVYEQSVHTLLRQWVCLQWIRVKHTVKALF